MAKRSVFTSVITGDIIQSRLKPNPVWLPKLKKVLSKEGDTPKTWEVYRGDSFQIEVKDPSNVLQTALRIKATIKTIKDLDVRMALGIGKKRFVSKRVAESDGEAFVFSGETFETLKAEKRTLAIKTPWPELNRELNICLKLASIPMDDWTTSSAELVALVIDYPDLTQQALAKRLRITQPAVSDRQNRAHYEAILELEALFREKIAKLVTKK